MDVDTRHATIDSLISITFLAAGCFFISNNMRYYLPRQEKYWYIIITSLAISGSWLLVLHGVMWLVFNQTDPYPDYVRSTFTVRFSAGFLMTSSVSMFSLLWYSQQEQKVMDIRKSETERLTREAELFKLRQQLQPHFLFNSLNSISALTGTQPEKARHMIQQLSDFLRGTLKKEDELWQTLEEELQHLQLYLEIEKVRFGHRLKTELTCQTDTMQMTIPALLLQPVVENSIKFGLYDTTGDVLIRLQAITENHFLKIVISNPFDPETSQPLKGTGFGLSSVSRRLFLLFAQPNLLLTAREDGDFITTILIPQMK